MFSVACIAGSWPIIQKYRDVVILSVCEESRKVCGAVPARDPSAATLCQNDTRPFTDIYIQKQRNILTQIATNSPTNYQK